MAFLQKCHFPAHVSVPELQALTLADLAWDYKNSFLETGILISPISQWFRFPRENMETIILSLKVKILTEAAMSQETAPHERVIGWMWQRSFLSESKRWMKSEIHSPKISKLFSWNYGLSGTFQLLIRTLFISLCRLHMQQGPHHST